jgi:MFS family permease
MTTTMSPPEPSPAPSPSPAPTLIEERHPVSPGAQGAAPRDGKAEADRRSTFASICIVAACTSAQLTSIGLGPAYAISVPSVGKDLHIQKDKLQWILNSYSISSVSDSSYETHGNAHVLTLRTAQACFLLLCGRLADLYGRKRVWLVGYLILVVFGIGAGFAQCTFCSVQAWDMSFSPVDTTAAKVLDILRGLQGIGSAAIIPASVSVFLVVCRQTLTFGGLPLARNSS